MIQNIMLRQPFKGIKENRRGKKIGKWREKKNLELYLFAKL